MVLNVRFSCCVTFINVGLGADGPNPGKKNEHAEYDEDKAPPWELSELVEVNQTIDNR
jgi:hypothetical protein